MPLQFSRNYGDCHRLCKKNGSTSFLYRTQRPTSTSPQRRLPHPASPHTRAGDLGTTKFMITTTPVSLIHHRLEHWHVRHREERRTASTRSAASKTSRAGDGNKKPPPRGNAPPSRYPPPKPLLKPLRRRLLQGSRLRFPRATGGNLHAGMDSRTRNCTPEYTCTLNPRSISLQSFGIRDSQIGRCTLIVLCDCNYCWFQR